MEKLGHLAEAVNNLLQDHDLRCRMGQQAQARAVAEFALPAMVDRVLALYNEVLSS